MIKADLRKRLKKSINGAVSFNKDLRQHTTFKIGGKATLWIEPLSLEDLRRALSMIERAGLKPLVIGNGSNLLISDGTIDRAVIRLSRPYFKKAQFNGNLVTCGAGGSLSRLIRVCIKRGVSGLEGLGGIPGTVGGAIMMNAAAGDDNIGKLIEWVKVIDYKKRKEFLLKKDKLKFSYRNSSLSGYIILEAGLLLKKKNSRIVRQSFNRSLKKKARTQEYRYPSAGCIFKNPKHSSLTSGHILDQCGLKGLNVNDAQVSTRHANFIINKGRARFDDVISLIKIEQDIVKKNYGVWLEPEIEIIR